MLTITARINNREIFHVKVVNRSKRSSAIADYDVYLNGELKAEVVKFPRHRGAKALTMVALNELMIEENGDDN